MKKLFAIAVLALFVLVAVNQGQAQFQKGKSFLGPHVGLSGIGSTFTLGGDYEYGVTENIGVGLTVDYWSYSFGYSGPSDWSYSYIPIGATGSYHFAIPDMDKKWDFFAGLIIGYYVVSVTEPADFHHLAGFDYATDASRIFFGVHGGVRYFFSPTIAAQARVGFGAYIVAVGVDFKF
jgi:hypothetical protein